MLKELKLKFDVESHVCWIDTLLHATTAERSAPQSHNTAAPNEKFYAFSVSSGEKARLWWFERRAPSAFFLLGVHTDVVCVLYLPQRRVEEELEIGKRRKYFDFVCDDAKETIFWIFFPSPSPYARCSPSFRICKINWFMLAELHMEVSGAAFIAEPQSNRRAFSRKKVSIEELGIASSPPS